MSDSSPADYELVPLTEQEMADLAESHATYLRGGGAMDEAQRVRAVNAFMSVQSQILEAHGFGPGNGVVSQDAVRGLTLTARRIKKPAQ